MPNLTIMPRKKLFGIKLWKNWEFTLYLRDQDAQWLLLQEQQERLAWLEARINELESNAQ